MYCTDLGCYIQGSILFRRGRAAVTTRRGILGMPKCHLDEIREAGPDVDALTTYSLAVLLLVVVGFLLDGIRGWLPVGRQFMRVAS